MVLDVILRLPQVAEKSSLHHLYLLDLSELSLGQTHISGVNVVTMY